MQAVTEAVLELLRSGQTGALATVVQVSGSTPQNPGARLLVRHDGSEHEDTPETRLPDGRAFRRAYRIARVRWLDQISDSELIYYVDGKRYVQAFEMRWFLNAELRHLLARAGFRVVAMYGDFARGPLVDGAPEQVVVAEFTP